MYAKGSYEGKYQYLINEREGVGVDHFNDPKAVIEYSNYMYDVYENINDCTVGKDRKILIVFHDMTADIIKNKRLSSIVT